MLSEINIYAIILVILIMTAFNFLYVSLRRRNKKDDGGKIDELTNSVTSLLNNMPGLTFSKDVKNGKYLACNQKFAEYAGKASPEDVIGNTDMEIFDHITAKHFMEDDKRALAMDEPYVFFEDVADAAGSPRQFQTTKLKFTDTTGRLCLLGMSVDVTEMMELKRENRVHSRIAQALSSDYTFIYYVNTKTNRYINYSYDNSHMAIESRRQGENFFEQTLIDAESAIYHEDIETFKKRFTKDNVIRSIEDEGIFMITYRLLMDGFPVYMSLKATITDDDSNHIIIGVSNVDAYMRAQETAERAREEKHAYARISALSGDYVAIYTVDPKTDLFTEYSVKGNYAGLELPKEGDDFFERSRRESRSVIYKDDLNTFLSVFTKENVMNWVRKNHIFSLDYRLLLDGIPTYVQLKAALIQESDGEKLVVGVSNIDANVKREQEYAFNLSEARNRANLDALTGVKNKHAYVDLESDLNKKIRNGDSLDFAIAVFDVNGLKEINDSDGHSAGDIYIRDASGIICDAFKDSPVFRIGGDEFAVVIQGSSYESLHESMAYVQKKNEENIAAGKVTVACGVSKYNRDRNVEEVFKRADQKMYENKRSLKAAIFKGK